jgi:hypothetical protein
MLILQFAIRFHRNCGPLLITNVLQIENCKFQIEKWVILCGVVCQPIETPPATCYDHGPP